MHPHLSNLCHFKAVFFQRAALCTLAWPERSGACHWSKGRHVPAFGWPAESRLFLDWIARPVVRKGVAAWNREVRKLLLNLVWARTLTTTQTSHFSKLRYTKAKRSTIISSSWKCEWKNDSKWYPIRWSEYQWKKGWMWFRKCKCRI